MLYNMQMDHRKHYVQTRLCRAQWTHSDVSYYGRQKLNNAINAGSFATAE